MKAVYKFAFKALCALGRPFGGVRPRRLYDILGRRAYDQPEFTWQRNIFGAELLLSPHYHIDRNILIFGCYDNDLHQAFERLIKPGMVCMDVGANLGEMALHMASLTGPTGAVYAFEPVAPVFERLRVHVERNKLQQVVRVLPLALSDQTGSCEIAYAASQADNQGLASIVNLEQSDADLKQHIDTVTLDDFVQRENLQRIDLMKIDIQGAEMKLLRGGADALKRFSPDLLMEVSPGDLAKANTNSRELCQVIESYGYSIFSIRHGNVGAKISAAAVKQDFHATNVYCTRKSL